MSYRLSASAALTTVAGTTFLLLLFTVFPVAKADGDIRSAGMSAASALFSLGAARTWRLATSMLAGRRRELALQELRAAEEDGAAEGVTTIAGLRTGGVDVLAAGNRFVFTTRPVGSPRPLPPEYEVAGRAHLDRLIFSAQLEGRHLFDGAKVDVRDLQVRRRADGVREVIASTTETSYYPYLAISHSLDVPLSTFSGEPTTWRQMLEPQPIAVSENVAELRAPVSLGTVTVVRTSDGYLLAGLRGATAQSGRPTKTSGPTAYAVSPWQERAADLAPACGSVSDPQYVDPSGRPLLHFVAEGCMPNDLDPLTHHVDTAVTAARGLSEELGHITSGSSVMLSQVPLRNTAVFFDQVRWEVVTTYLADLPMTVNDVREAAAEAPDRFEVDRWIALDASNIEDADLRALLHGRHERWVLASNHAVVALQCAIVEIHGHHAVKHHLSRPLR